VAWRSWSPLDWEGEERFPEPRKLIIVAAAPGGMVSKEQNPHLPCTPEEIARYHIEAYRAGAQIVHIHARGERCIPSSKVETYREIISRVKDECPDVIIDACLAHPLEEDTVEARLKPLCEAGLPIDIATYSVGSHNVAYKQGSTVYINRGEYTLQALNYLLGKGIKPLLVVYNHKTLEWVKRNIVKPKLVDRVFLNLSLGLFGEPADIDILRGLVRALPPDCDWVLESAGRNWLPLAVEALLLGGNVRAGMEDGIYMYPHRDDLIKSSAEAVGKIVRIAKELGREVATPKEARRMLGLKG
jgi:3-keto-5-aminohexanoate cleavage enzyme